MVNNYYIITCKDFVQNVLCDLRCEKSQNDKCL